MVANQDFDDDIFLSHSGKDEAMLWSRAEQLRQDALKVWFDEWMLKPAANIPTMIEERLERSRFLVVDISSNAFGSNWARFEGFLSP